MLTEAENHAMTSIGPGTLMGSLMRQYWIPALKSAELPANDGAQVRVMLLGERLIAFRDTSGGVGLLAEACPHRGASLFFGRNEQGGIRCAYHGWKFNTSGECLDMPCEPQTAVFRRRIRTRAYPCVERGGVVWAYMGAREIPPPLPDLVMNSGPEARGRVDVAQVECNWLQNLDGDIDLDHIAILHGANLSAFKAVLRGEEERRADPSRSAASDYRSFERSPVEIVDSEVGCTFACRVMPQTRAGDTPEAIALPELWAVGQFMFPFYSMLPYGSFGAHWVAARVPMDDHHTLTFGMYASDGTTPPAELMFGPAPTYLPDSTGWFGRHRLARNRDNDFGLDRGLAGSTSGPFGIGVGIRGQAVQDASIACSMGYVVDRTKEHLGVGDAVIVHVRKRLLDAARALAERNITPPGVNAPAGYRVGQGIVCVRPGRAWREEAVNDVLSSATAQSGNVTR